MRVVVVLDGVVLVIFVVRIAFWLGRFRVYRLPNFWFRWSWIRANRQVPHGFVGCVRGDFAGAGDLIRF